MNTVGVLDEPWCHRALWRTLVPQCWQLSCRSDLFREHHLQQNRLELSIRVPVKEGPNTLQSTPNEDYRGVEKVDLR